MDESLTDLVKDIRRLFMLVYPGQYNVMADVIAKDAFIDALEDEELTILVMKKSPNISNRPSRLQKGWNFVRGRSSLRARMGSNPS